MAATIALAISGFVPEPRFAAALLATRRRPAIENPMQGERGEPISGQTSVELERLILAVARQRDRGAFASLYRHFAPRLKSYLLRLGADAGTAEEVMQESMLVLWRRADSFDPSQASASTWVFTIARNKRIDGLRRGRRPEFDPEDPALMPSAPEPADRRLETAERNHRLRQAIEALPDEQARLLQLAYYDDMSHSAIAETTRLPLGTVKSRLRLAFGRLRQALGEPS